MTTPVVIDAILACTYLVSTQPLPGHLETVEAWSTCVLVGVEAVKSGECPFECAAQAYRETKLNAHAVGAAGEIGPIQVLPRYWCPKGSEPCDTIAAAMTARSTLRSSGKRSERSVMGVLCRYNLGTAGFRRTGATSCRYGRRVKSLAIDIEKGTKKIRATLSRIAFGVVTWLLH